jgi:hypothetical protein
MFIDGKERSYEEIVSAIRLKDRCTNRGSPHIVEADDKGLISGRAWGMMAEPSAHLENTELARLANCAYEQIFNQKVDGRFYCPLTGFTLLTLQIKHSAKGNFLTSADEGTKGGKSPYNVTDVEFFQFRQSCPPCHSVFAPLRDFPVDENGNLLQKSSLVDHEHAKFSVQRCKKDATTPEQLVELLKTRLYFMHYSLNKI